MAADYDLRNEDCGMNNFARAIASKLDVAFDTALIAAMDSQVVFVAIPAVCTPNLGGVITQTRLANSNVSCNALSHHASTDIQKTTTRRALKLGTLKIR
jgi:hypothetical protein